MQASSEPHQDAVQHADARDRLFQACDPSLVTDLGGLAPWGPLFLPLNWYRLDTNL
jgi:hypothetical protein